MPMPTPCSQPVEVIVTDTLQQPKESTWDGKTPISQNGIYQGISLDAYHNNLELLDAPAVSKSALKWLDPIQKNSSPKAFWGRWKYNPDHIKPKPSEALDFGKATHCLLLGDEDFDAAFVVRPEKYPDYKKKEAQEWKAQQIEAGKTIVTPEQYERIQRMRDDANQYPLVQQGLMTGRVERSMFWKDPETGIWLKARPDVIPNADAVYADLKTASSFDEDFLSRQVVDAGYYLQAAMTRMVCRGINVPFKTFVLLYVLNDDVPDTSHVEIDEEDIDRGEDIVRYGLRTIRECLDSGYWPGKLPFSAGERFIKMKPWSRQLLDQFIAYQHQIAA
ncbi:hypothetical protein D7027_13020 [Ochrobactrum intermedium]|nr:hypothetical protein [Brucella intermedia]